MKVKFKYGIKTYSGTLEEMVFGSYREDNLCIGRKYVMPELTPQNGVIGGIMKNLSSLYAEALEDYKGDLKIYSKLNGKQNVSKNQLVPTAYAIFVKMMFAWQAANPGSVDLATVTIEDIVSLPAPVICVADAISEGLIANVVGGELLIEQIG